MGTVSREVEIELADLTTEELCTELEERIEDHTILFTDEAKAKHREQQNEMLLKLTEIRYYLGII